MLFWIIAGVVGLGLYFLSQNKTEKRDKTTITHKRVIQTHDGEVHIHRTQTIDSVQTTYSKQDSTSQAVKNIVDALPHANQTIAAPVSQEIKSEPLIISEDQPHRFAHYQQESKPESFALTQPKNDIQPIYLRRNKKVSRAQIAKGFCLFSLLASLESTQTA